MKIDRQPRPVEVRTVKRPGWPQARRDRERRDFWLGMLLCAVFAATLMFWACMLSQP